MVSEFTERDESDGLSNFKETPYSLLEFETVE